MKFAFSTDSASEEEDGGSDPDALSTTGDEDLDYDLCDDSEEEDDDDVEEEGMEEDEGAGAEEVSEWLSKNKKILWSSTNEVSMNYVPPTIPPPGPTHFAVARIRSPLNAFDLFFTDQILSHIVKMTNLQGQRTTNHWKNTTTEELRTFIGLLILAGVYRSRHEATFSLWEKKTGRPIFAETMTHHRFKQLNAKLTFDDQLARPQRHARNKLAPISDVWEMWSHLHSKMFKLGRDVCVDEQLVSFRGRCSFRQYIPSKPAKYGIKIWTLCDAATAYAWKMEIYTGEAAGAPRETNQGMNAVLRLCDMLEGHVVTADNFFTSYPLAQELIKRKMALVGTLRKNKMEIPPNLLDRNRPLLSSKFAFTRYITLVSYIPKKNKTVLLLSSKHRDTEVDDGPKKKPTIILDYNKSKGAVDHLDQACGTYSSRLRATRWPMRVFYHMLDVSCFNAYILYTDVEPRWNQGKLHKRRLFLEEVGAALLSADPKQACAAEESAAKSDSPRKRRKCRFCVEKVTRASQLCGKCTTPICHKHTRRRCPKC